MNRATMEWIRPSNPSGEAARNDSVRHIGIFVLEGCCMSTSGFIGEAFHLANKLTWVADGHQAYRVSWLSKQGGYITSSSSMAIRTQPLGAYSAHDFHALFVACKAAPHASGADSKVSRWLSGGESLIRMRDFDLPTSGEYSKPSRSGTTSIAWFSEGGLSTWTSSHAAVQLAIAQIEMDLSGDISDQVARSFQPPIAKIYPPGYDDVNLNTATAIYKIHKSVHWLRENFGNDISVAVAASIAAMSERHYLRCFKAEFGITPQEYLTRLRFDAICRMLVETQLPVDKIARRCGMGNGDRLGRLFHKRYGATPTAYRQLLRIQSPGSGGAVVKRTDDSLAVLAAQRRSVRESGEGSFPL